MGGASTPAIRNMSQLAQQAAYTPRPNPVTGALVPNAITGLTGAPPKGYDPRAAVAQQMTAQLSGQNPTGGGVQVPQTQYAPHPIAPRPVAPQRNYGDIAQMLAYVQGQRPAPPMPSLPPDKSIGIPPKVPRAVM